MIPFTLDLLLLSFHPPKPLCQSQNINHSDNPGLASQCSTAKLAGRLHTMATELPRAQPTPTSLHLHIWTPIKSPRGPLTGSVPIHSCPVHNWIPEMNFKSKEIHLEHSDMPQPTLVCKIAYKTAHYQVTQDWNSVSKTSNQR